MRRRARVLALAFLAALVSVPALFVLPALAQPPGAPFCAPGQAPAFVYGIAALRDRLGQTMGAPLECEHVDAQSGDAVQRTTTGLAYYRPSINTAIFTDGETHWALSEGTVLLWRGPSVRPPQPTDAEAAYLQRTAPLQSRADALQRRLAGVRLQVERGQIDTLDLDSLRSLVDDLRATRDAYVRAGGPGRLWRYHGMMVVSLNEGMGAAEMLAQARQIESPDARARLLASAMKHRQESERAQAAATDAYSQALPVVVDRAPG
jgi:hypothetical protein